MHYERFARLIVTGMLLGSAPLGCARPAAPVAAPEQAPQRASCTLVEPPSIIPETLVIALPPGRVGGFSAPALFDAQSFEAELTRSTLVDVDCTGAIVHELAESWEIDTARSRWTVTLSDDATLTNGDPLTSREVFAAWHAADLDSLLAAVRESLVALDTRRVRVTLPFGTARLLASSRLAVLERRPSDLPDDSTFASSARDIGLDSPRLGRLGSGAPAIIYGAIQSGSDPRDVIDRGVDILFTEDPAAARYATARPEYSVHGLPAQRLYALAIPAVSPSSDSIGDDLEELVGSLVRDVVRVPAQPASREPWWSDTSTCSMAPVEAQKSGGPRLSRVAYREDDPVARAIAERIVAIAARSVAAPIRSMITSSGGEPLSAEGLSPGEFLAAAREGSRAAYVVSVPARPIEPCQALERLIAAVPWAFGERASQGVRLIPLVEAGAWAVVRHGSVGLATSWDGTPILLLSSFPGAAP